MAEAPSSAHTYGRWLRLPGALYWGYKKSGPETSDVAARV